MILHLGSSRIGGGDVKAKSRGMTLVELIAAIAILGMVLVSASMLICTIAKYNNIMKCKITNAAIAQEAIEYYKTYDFSKLSDIKNKKYEQYIYFAGTSTSDTLINDINTFSLIEVDGVSSEKYEDVVNNHLSSVPSKNYDHIIKAVFANKGDNMVAIDATVWDTRNKDQCKMEYVTLKGY